MSTDNRDAQARYDGSGKRTEDGLSAGYVPDRENILQDLSVDSPICDIQCVHPEVIDHYGKELIGLDKANQLAALFKTLGDPTRVRIMDALAKGEFCVCDLAELLNLTQSATSHQLRILRSANLVKYRRDGKLVYYSLDDDHVLELYRQGLEHIAENK